jgi:hypothetical protein
MKNDMNKYVIIDPEDGVFLGTTGRDAAEAFIDVPRGARVIALFSGNNIFDLTKAAAFFTERDADDYMRAYIKRPSSRAFVAKIESDSKEPYVDVVDLIKSGYGEYVEDMVDAIPMLSQDVH